MDGWCMDRTRLLCSSSLTSHTNNPLAFSYILTNVPWFFDFWNQGVNWKESILFKLVLGGISFLPSYNWVFTTCGFTLVGLLYHKAQGEPYHKPKYMEHEAIREGWILCLLFRSRRDLTPMLCHLQAFPTKKPEVKLIISLNMCSTKQ
jgi:hypothetical protein